ncbi:LysR family transcriptional regulator [Oxalobacteraceae bacterium OTU3REALA1]|nr:LysR family transcriptional regulator [Oxalobacteraceae bacterium OTU3REALA1]
MEMLKEMAIFAQVVDSGGFSAAARQLGLTTSAVSRHVSRLETYMGGRLLQRTTRSVSLTELGEQVQVACVRMVNTAREIHALAGSYSARPNGVVRISAPVVLGQLWLAPLLPAFLDRYPEVDVRLSLVDRNVDLIEEGIDLAIRISADLAPGLAARPLGPMRYVLVASPQYLAAHGTPATPQELPSHRCNYLGYARFGAAWTMRREGIDGPEIASIRVPSRLTINNSAALMAVVEAGGGIGLVPDFTARSALAQGRAVRILADWTFDEPYAGTVHAVYMPGPHLALKVRAMIDYLVAEGALGA